MDFLRGAARSKGGKPIIALALDGQERNHFAHRADARSGRGRGDQSRADVRYVVTEYGVAYLHGKTMRRAGRGADRDRASQVPRRAVRVLRKRAKWMERHRRERWHEREAYARQQAYKGTSRSMLTNARDAGLCVESCPPKMPGARRALSRYGVHPAHLHRARLHRMRHLLLCCPEPGAITVYRWCPPQAVGRCQGGRPCEQL